MAVFTSQDTRGHRYWLGRVEKPPTNQPLSPVLTGNAKCPISGEKFERGERVLWVSWFDRLGAEDLSFRHKPELGTAMIPASILRLGKINLQEYTITSRTNGYSLSEAIGLWHAG